MEKCKTTKKDRKQLPQKPEKTLLKKIFSSIYFWLGALLLVITFILSYYSSLTKISISPNVYLDPSDPCSASFVFKNDSLFPIYNVDYQFYLRNIKVANTIGISSIFVKSDEPPLNVFKPSQSFSDFIAFPFKFEASSRWLSADIDIEVIYKPKFWFWNKTVSIRFLGKKDINGDLKWIIAKPLDDLPPPDNRSVLIYTGKRKY